MKKIIFLVIIGIIWSGIHIVSAQESLVVESGSKVTIRSTLRIWNEKGRIIETSSESIAKAAGIYSPDVKYGPYEISVDTGSIIQWLYKWLIGMKKWEKKKLVIPPNEWHLNSKSIDVIPYTDIAPIFTYRVNRYALTSDLIITIPRSDIPDLMKV